MLDAFDAVAAFASATALFVVNAVFVVFVLLRPRVRQPSSLAWILVIVVLPIAGIVLYLAVGEVRTGSRRKRRHRTIQKNIRAVVRKAWSATSRSTVVPWGTESIARLARLGDETQPRQGNRLALLATADSFLQALVADIDAAERHVHLLFYIYLDDDVGRAVASALIRARKREVPCRLLVDNVGSSDFLKSRLCRELRDEGVQVVAALPTRITQIVSIRFDMRNHRKIGVVDGRVGYTGSHNVASENFHPKPGFGPWVDATLRIEGPAVRDLQALFIEDWYMDTTENLDHMIAYTPEEHPDGRIVQIVGTGVNSQNQALVRVIQSAIHMAREELIMTTPYFVPDEGTLAAITTAAIRGVRTIIVVPARNDSPLVALASRSFYETLLDAGAEVHEYTSGLLHAKTITVDRDFALVSTANLDRRSFEINFEISTLIYDSDFASELRLLQMRYLEDCVTVDAARWAARRWPRRLAENVAGLVSALL
ncbi:MAG: cardiolipin synthase [Gemmatimonadetes bacterium]|nr:cardiolipin synthase [Gemmatimonadota bacterium]MYA64579.1 cardiolipin synthase [Gemmatimonadota bacterium]MYC00164.1 cardiolipin synthase [Gemmatimonadota bacterium]MYH52014.1 cardiolipin synthase [Gemmatimonadota bacterium]MYI46243.1 cardiolipin synthase [Gemmatimonadota bacterium]